MAFIDIHAGRVRPLGEPSADQLIAAAVAQGGELGRAAERLQNPKSGFFATLPERSAGALDKFITTLMTPLYGVAGALDPDQTIAEAIRNRTTPGEVLLTRPDAGSSKGERAAYQVTKFAVDTLLDPLTYLTFGASKGLVGLTKGTQFLMKENVAKQVGGKADMYGYFNKAGDARVDKLFQTNLEGLRHTYFRQEKKRLKASGMKDDDIITELSRLDKTVSDSMIKLALNSKLDRRWAAQTVGNMLEKFPHLANELLDKGGIKWAGMTLLSAQRIQTIGAMIPGMTKLDELLLPVRKVIGNAFDTKYSGGERMTDKMVEMREAARLGVQSQTGELVKYGANLNKILKLTDEEWSFVSAAIEKGLEPRDPKASDAWRLAFGQAPKNGTIPDEIWRGVLAVKGMQVASRDSLVKTGMKLPDHENFLSHLAVREDVGGLTSRSAGKLTQTTDRAKFAKYFTLADEQGIRFPFRADSVPDKDGMVKGVMLKEGKEVQMTIKAINSSKEIEKLEAMAKVRTEGILESITKAREAIKEGTQTIKGTMAARLTESLIKKLDNVPGINAVDKESIAGAVSRVIDDASVEKIVSKRMSRFYKNGLKLKDGRTAKEADLEKLAQDIVTAKSEASEIAGKINKLLATGPKLPHAKTATLGATAKADKEVMKLAKGMKKEADAIRKATLERKLDTKGVENLLEQIVARTSKNPVGLNRIIDSIIENKQLAKELKEELSEVSRAVKIEADILAEESGNFLTETGRYLARNRATIEEAEKLGGKFEKNALAVALMTSKDAIDTSVARVFVKNAAEGFGVRASQAGTDWVPLQDLGMKIEDSDISRFITTKSGEELYFHPTVAAQIQDFAKTITKDENIADVMRAYDSLQNYFKAAVTSVWPAFHGRNALSNVFLMYNKIGAEVLNPVNHVATSNFLNMERKMHALQKKMVKGDEHAAEYAKLMMTEVFRDKTGKKGGYRWSYGELRTQMMDQVVAFHPRNVGMTDQLRFGVNEVNEAKKLMFPKTGKEKAMAYANSEFNPFNSDNWVFKKGFQAGQVIEDYSRTLTFLAQMRHTGDPIQAAQITKQALFDYSNLTTFEKEVMRRIVPFYSFSRKNIELQIDTLLHNPGKISQQIRGVGTIGDAINGETLSDEEMAALPDWAKEGYSLVTKREGSHITLLKTLGTPVEELFNRTSAHSNIGMISPLIKAPLEFGTDYSFFHGRPISKVTQADAYQYAPKFIQEFIGYEEVKYKNPNTGKTESYHTSFRPDMMYIINTLQPSGRLLSEINRAEKAPEGAARFMAVLFGFGTREFDIEREMQKRETERKEELEDIFQQAGLGYKFTRYVQKKPQDLVQD